MTKRATEGRYTNVRAARAPGDHLPKEGKRGHLQIAHGIVDDPNPSFRGQKQRVAVNRKTDALELEYSYGRISEAAYRAGRAYAAVLERAYASPGGSTWREGNRVDPAWAVEARIVGGLANARQAAEMIDDVRHVIGMIAERLLFLVLAERLTLADATVRMCRSTDKRALTHHAHEFRSSLEALAAEWAKGRGPTR